MILCLSSCSIGLAASVCAFVGEKWINLVCLHLFQNIVPFGRSVSNDFCQSALESPLVWHFPNPLLSLHHCYNRCLFDLHVIVSLMLFRACSSLCLFLLLSLVLPLYKPSISFSTMTSSCTDGCSRNSLICDE